MERPIILDDIGKTFYVDDTISESQIQELVVQEYTKHEQDLDGESGIFAAAKSLGKGFVSGAASIPGGAMYLAEKAGLPSTDIFDPDGSWFDRYESDKRLPSIASIWKSNKPAQDKVYEMLGSMFDGTSLSYDIGAALGQIVTAVGVPLAIAAAVPAAPAAAGTAGAGAAGAGIMGALSTAALRKGALTTGAALLGAIPEAAGAYKGAEQRGGTPIENWTAAASQAAIATVLNKFSFGKTVNLFNKNAAGKAAGSVIEEATDALRSKGKWRQFMEAGFTEAITEYATDPLNELSIGALTTIQPEFIESLLNNARVLAPSFLAGGLGQFGYSQMFDAKPDKDTVDLVEAVETAITEAGIDTLSLTEATEAAKRSSEAHLDFMLGTALTKSGREELLGALRQRPVTEPFTGYTTDPRKRVVDILRSRFKEGVSTNDISWLASQPEIIDAVRFKNTATEETQLEDWLRDNKIGVQGDNWYAYISDSERQYLENFYWQLAGLSANTNAFDAGRGFSIFTYLMRAQVRAQGYKESVTDFLARTFIGFGEEKLQGGLPTMVDANKALTATGQPDPIDLMMKEIDEDVRSKTPILLESPPRRAMPRPTSKKAAIAHTKKRRERQQVQDMLGTLWEESGSEGLLQESRGGITSYDVMSGVPVQTRNTKGELSYTPFWKPGIKYYIRMSRAADTTTLVHEMSHFLLATSEGNLRSMIEIAGKRLYKRTSLSDWRVEDHEKFAAGFEQYMFNGTSTDKARAHIYDRLKSEMNHIYQTDQAFLSAAVPDEMKPIYKMLFNEIDTEVALEELADALGAKKTNTREKAKKPGTSKPEVELTPAEQAMKNLRKTTRETAKTEKAAATQLANQILAETSELPLKTFTQKPVPSAFANLGHGVAERMPGDTGVPLRVDVKNPITLMEEEIAALSTEDGGARLKAELQQRGHDAIDVIHTDGTSSTLLFDVTQAKPELEQARTARDAARIPVLETLADRPFGTGETLEISIATRQAMDLLEGAGVKKLLSKINSGKTKFNSPQELIAATYMLTDKLDFALSTLIKEDMTEEDLARLNSFYEHIGTLMDSTASHAGRMLRYMQVVHGMIEIQEAMTEYAQAIVSGKISKTPRAVINYIKAANLKDMDLSDHRNQATITRLRKLVAKSRGDIAKGALWSFYYNNMLASPATWGLGSINTVSTLFKVLTTFVDAPQAALFDKAIAKLTGRPRMHTATTNMYRMLMRAHTYKRAGKSWWDSISASNYQVALAKMGPYIKKWDQQMNSVAGNISDALVTVFDDFSMKFKSKPLGKSGETFANTVGRVMEMPSRMLAASDMMMKTLAGDFAISQYNELVELNRKRKTLKPFLDALTERIVKYRGEGFLQELYAQNAERYNEEIKSGIPHGFDADEDLLRALALGQGYREMAEEQATFQDPPDVFSQKIMQIPGRRLFMPFIQSTMRAFWRGFEYVPVAGIAVGQMKGFRVNATMAETAMRQMQGLTLLAIVGTKVLDGTITGPMPKEDKDRNRRGILLSAGWQPYSFNINGRFYPFSQMEPLATPIKLIASTITELQEAEQMDPGPDKDRYMSRIIEHTIANLGDFFVENTPLKGFTDYLAGDELTIARRTAGTAGAIIPYSALWRSLARKDGDITTSNGIAQMFAQSSGLTFFGVGEGLQRYDALGNPMKRQTNWFKEWFPVFKYSDWTGDEKESEFQRLGYYPGMPLRSRALRLGPKQFVLLNDQQYNELVERSGGDLKMEITKLLSKPFYKASSDARKRDLLAKTAFRSRRVSLNKFKADYRKTLLAQSKTGAEVQDLSEGL